MVAAVPCASRRSFRDSVKVLEADIQHANTLASECLRVYDGACLQMRMSYSPSRISSSSSCSAPTAASPPLPIYKVYVDSTTTMSTHERKASIKEFYAVIFPSLMQLEHGISDTDYWRQRADCSERYRRRDGEREDSKRPVSEIDARDRRGVWDLHGVKQQGCAA